MEITSIENVKTKHFLQLPPHQMEKVLKVLQFVKPTPFIKVGWLHRKKGVRSITELSFKEVSELKFLLTNPKTANPLKAVEKVYKINPLNLKIITLWGCVNFLKNEVEKVLKAEAERYRSEPSKYADILESAGGKELAKFDDISVLDTLTGGNILNFEKVENLPYSLVHYYLWYRTEKENINIRFERLLYNK